MMIFFFICFLLLFFLPSSRVLISLPFPSLPFQRLFYIPPLLIITASVSLRLYWDVYHYALANPYFSSESLRTDACQEIKSGSNTFVCAIKEGTFWVRYALFGLNWSTLIIAVAYVVVAWKVLSRESWHDNRDANISLRLYVWHTSLLAVVFMSVKITQFVALDNNDACKYLLQRVVSSPMLYQAFTVWVLLRSYLFTPVPNKWRRKPYYKVRQTFLQTFLWDGGEGEGMETTTFWEQVVGDAEGGESAVRRQSVMDAMMAQRLSARKARCVCVYFFFFFFFVCLGVRENALNVAVFVVVVFIAAYAASLRIYLF